MNYIYLWVNLLTLIPPLLLTFHPLLILQKRWSSLWPAILLVAVIFILLDMLFTSYGIWGFNNSYLLGIQIGNLPLEEVLFFICIPYACIFSYHCLNTQVKKDYFKKIQIPISIAILIFATVMLLIYYHKWYTFFAFSTVFVLVFMLQFVFKVSWLSRFYFAYLILQIPFLIVNGILTGSGLQQPIVWYNEAHIIGLRILTIPFEDVFYGMAMLLLSTGVYEYFLSKKAVKNLC